MSHYLNYSNIIDVEVVILASVFIAVVSGSDNKVVVLLWLLVRHTLIDGYVLWNLSEVLELKSLLRVELMNNIGFLISEFSQTHQDDVSSVDPYSVP